MGESSLWLLYTAIMRANQIFEQHVAVFGESGSGKTVLLSSFFGASQDTRPDDDKVFRIVADDIGQGNVLRQNYLGMKKDAEVPPADTFKSHSYAFNIRLAESGAGRRKDRNPFEALRLVWHDYPGEWFEQGISSPTLAQRRVDTFRSLLESDVALLLVDGQSLLAYQGEEERYLKSLFSNFRDGLLTLKDDLMENGKPLVEFPRIWIIALSKADLLPGTDVDQFKDLMIYKAAHEIEDLRQVIAEFIDVKEALSVGEDFLLLSSAKFEPDKIEVEERIGIDLILPLAAMLPFERRVRWEQRMQLPRKVAENLVGPAAAGIALVLTHGLRLPGPLRLIQPLVAALVTKEAMSDAAGLVKDRLVEANKAAKEREDYLAATLTGFKLALERGEQDGILRRSDR